jgi:hypothetical protein
MKCPLALGSLLLLWACDGDTTPPSFFDSGTDATTDATSDSGDASDASDAGPTSHAKVIVVHASPDLPAVRVCFATGLQNDGSDAQMAPIAPLPKTGIAPGGGAILPDLGVDLSQKAITPYVMIASKIAGNATCDQLATTLTANTDYFALPTIKNGTFAAGTTVLVAATGCLPTSMDGLADITTCGADYNATKGNLAIQDFKLDRVIGNTQRFGAQLAHVASPASGVWTAQYGATDVSASLSPFDGGATEIIVDHTKLFTLAPGAAASLAMPTVDQTSLVVAAVNPDGGAPPKSMSIPLPLVYEATTGQATGENAYFAPGVNYTFVFVGDPRQQATMDGGVFNGYSLHALAFPNDPALPTQ